MDRQAIDVFAILEPISAFNAQECANYFKHAGQHFNRRMP
jgi:hypothetical protein